MAREDQKALQSGGWGMSADGCVGPFTPMPEY